MPIPEIIWIFSEDLEDVARHGDTDIGHITNMKDHYAKDDIEYTRVDIAEKAITFAVKTALLSVNKKDIENDYITSGVIMKKERNKHTSRLLDMAIDIQFLLDRERRYEGALRTIMKLKKELTDCNLPCVWEIANEAIKP